MSTLRPPNVKIPRTGRSREFIVTFAMIFALIAGLLMLDLFLARIDRNETSQHAANLFRDGRSLLARGKSSDAAERLATAVALDRGNPRYGLALAQALLADGRSTEAETLLTDLLSRSPDDGPISLTMARLLAITGRQDRAKAFYHRAIFGRWGSDSTIERMTTRFELIDLLARQGAHEELLAELLPLQSVAADSTMLLQKVAPLYLQAESPERAVGLYQALLRRTPDDLPVYVGLSDAYLDLGQLRQARSTLSRAVRMFPSDTLVSRRLQDLDSAFALDPGSRGLSDAGRVERSRALLARTVDYVDRCRQNLSSPEGIALEDTARLVLQAPRPRQWNAAAVERELNLSESLWGAKPGACNPAADREGHVLDLVQRLLKR